MRAAPAIVGGAALLALLLFTRRAAAADLPGDRTVTDVSGASVPRGIRNNNPGNLRPSSRYTWQGQIGSDSGRYLIFDTARNGLRAMTINLLNQQLRNGLNTVRAIFTRYAPPSDNNDTPAYIAAVSDALGVGPDDRLNLSTDRAQLRALVGAVILQENGAQSYSVAQLDTAIGDAITAVLS